MNNDILDTTPVATRDEKKDIERLLEISKEIKGLFPNKSVSIEVHNIYWGNVPDSFSFSKLTLDNGVPFMYATFENIKLFLKESKDE